MMADNLILVTRDGWQQLRDGTLSEVPAWLALDRPSAGADRLRGSRRWAATGSTAASPPMPRR
jgi:hypothetical protein